MDTTTDLRVNTERLLASLEAVSSFGATPAGGLSRLALSAEDALAREYLRAQALDHGLGVSSDQIGNIFVTLPGRDPDLPSVLIGSHLDSQPFGGRYDGTYGVLAGLEVLRTVSESGKRPLRSIVLADWTNEEGARFAPSMMGSAVFAGRLRLEDALATRDQDGTTVAEALAEIGQRTSPGSGTFQLHRSFELHIEQGPILETLETAIGVVTGVQGIHWLDVRLTGTQGHAGTVPAASRRDPMAAAGRVAASIAELPSSLGPDLRATVGAVHVVPNARNVIPAEVLLEVDLRHPVAEVLEEATARIRALGADLASRTRVTIETRDVLHQEPIAFDPGSTAIVRRAAKRLGLSTLDLAAGAGHDAVQLSFTVPTAMIFIPCIGGVSHVENEDIRPEWAVQGANVLLGSVIDAANEGATR